MSTTSALTVVVVDDHHLFRSGMVYALREHRLRVVAEAASGPDAVTAVLRTRPCVVLMDLELPGFSGVEATRRLAAAGSDAHVLALTVQAGRATVLEALAAGAAGFMLKDAPITEIVAAIHATAQGDAPISARAARGLVAHLQQTHQPSAGAAGTPPDLTDREIEVLALMADGCDNAQIAEQLMISPHTVKTHVSRLLAKLEVGNRMQAVIRAYREGLVTQGSGS